MDGYRCGIAENTVDFGLATGLSVSVNKRRTVKKKTKQGEKDF